MMSGVARVAACEFFHHERFTLRNLLGALVAAAGVVVLFLR
jgi:drug/metabolite transporter (DMT)-like permease